MSNSDLIETLEFRGVAGGEARLATPQDGTAGACLLNWLRKTALLLSMVFALVAAGAFSGDAEASKRLGGGGSSGQQSSIATQRQATPPAGSPAQQASAPAAAGAQAAAQSQRSRWLGPIAGLAAGLGIAALASHLGFGEELANFMMIALLALVVMGIVGFVLARRRAAQSPQPAYASAPTSYAQAGQEASGPERWSSPGPFAQPVGAGLGQAGAGLGAAPAASSQPWGVPADFDVPGFVENAKHYFRRLQVANDTANLADLREFTSPQLFEEFSAEIRQRQTENYTEVVRLDAELLGIETQQGNYLASVRFSGLVREGRNAAPQTFDEVWNLSKPVQGAGGWVLAGIQQMGAQH
jgi:predicted lipid-binding transport protein (Tim44 family)